MFPLIQTCLIDIHIIMTKRLRFEFHKSGHIKKTCNLESGILLDGQEASD